MGGGGYSSCCSCLAGPRVLRPCVRLPPLSPSGPSSPPSHRCPCTCTCTCPVTCRVGIPKHPCIYVCPWCTCMHVCVYMHSCACMHVCVHVCMCACMHVCMQLWLLLSCAAVCCCSPAFVSSATTVVAGAPAATTVSLTAAVVVFVLPDAPVAFLPLANEVAAEEPETRDFLSRL